MRPLRINAEKLLGKYTTIWNRIEYLKNIKLNASPVYGDRYIKAKKRTYGNKVYTNFRGLNVPEIGVKWESFTIFSIASLLVYENIYCLHVYLDNCAYKIVNTKMADYLDDNIFESDK